MPTVPLSSWPAVGPWAETATIAFAFAWGAMLGSFINVVAHRVPRGESVVFGRSRCPRCGAAVRPRDNVPVLGWLLLRGRCRDCAAPIAARYPLVEALCGLLVAGAAAVDLVAGGIDRVLLHGDVVPPARFVFHAGVLLTAVAWWRLAAAGIRASRQMMLLAMIAVGLLVVAWPPLQATGLLPAGAAWPTGHPRLAACLAWLAGAIAGSVCRFWFPGPEGDPLPLLAAALGWQAVPVVTALLAAGRMTGLRAGSRQVLEG